MVLCCGVLTFSSHAQTEQFTQEVLGLTDGTSYVIEDDKYPYMQMNEGVWSTKFKHLKVDDRIILSYEGLTGMSGESNVKLLLEWEDELFVTHSQQVDMSVSWSMDGLEVIGDRSTYYFQGGHKVRVKVIDVTGNLPANNLRLRTEINIDRGYYFSPQTPISFIGVDATDEQGYLTFHWKGVQGAVSYELEYVHINDYTKEMGVYQPPTALEYDFYLNSTRVEVVEPRYRIPSIFDHGYLLYRVRPRATSKILSEKSIRIFVTL
jgi:hypothetical protein